MPLPNYGYYNKEEKKHQDLVFQGAPQIVDVDEPLDGSGHNGNSRKESRKRGQVTTGTIGIDLERKLIMHAEKDAHIWKSPEIDRAEQEEIKKYTTKDHKNLKKEVKSALDSLISGSKMKEIKDNSNSSATESNKSNVTSQCSKILKKCFNNQRFGLPSVESPKSSFSSYGGRETTKTGVSIQPKGFYRLDSKKSIGSFNPTSPASDNSSSNGVTQSSSYSFSSRSSSSSYKY